MSIVCLKLCKFDKHKIFKRSIPLNIGLVTDNPVNYIFQVYQKKKNL